LRGIGCGLAGVGGGMGALAHMLLPSAWPTAPAFAGGFFALGAGFTPFLGRGLAFYR